MITRDEYGDYNKSPASHTITQSFIRLPNNGKHYNAAADVVDLP